MDEQVALLAATRLNASPTHGLYTDGKFELEEFMDASMEHPICQAEDYLGIRDVLDDEDALMAEWARKNALEAIERYYDEIWVYGIPAICEPLAGIGLSPRMEQRVRYTGYLRRTTPGWPAESPTDLPEEDYVLVTTGGGGDGAALVDWVIRAYERDLTLRQKALIVYGPFMTAAERNGFDARVAKLGGRVTAISFHARFERLLDAAKGVVLVHMLGRDASDWKYFAARLNRSGFTVIAPDLRGHGSSDGADADLTDADVRGATGLKHD